MSGDKTVTTPDHSTSKPPWDNRAYVQLNGPFDSRSYWSAIKTGRSFATSGPMLNLTAGDHKLGDTIDVEGQVPKLISVTAHLRSDQEIEALEIVQDGNVVASVDLRKRFNGSALDEKLNQEL